MSTQPVIYQAQDVSTWQATERVVSEDMLFK